ncbi:MAG: DUF4968 domain-containing protein [Microscillaceae bacterium]|nr:DUF4968 domain-containing protein [Microscillaceae bacterium]
MRLAHRWTTAPTPRPKPGPAIPKPSLENQILSIQTNDGTYRLRPFHEKTVEVSFIPRGLALPDSSHAVVLSPQAHTIRFQEDETKIILHSESLRIEIQKSPFRLSFYNQDQLLTQETEGYFEQGAMRGFAFALQEEEALYGTGARALPLDRRGYRLELYNKAHYAYADTSYLMNYNLPLVLSTQKYLLYFDNAAKGFLDLGHQQPNTLRFETIGGRMTYYVVIGEDFYDVMRQYTALTGRQPLPPRWAFGNFASRYGYRSEAQVRETLALFRRDSIPVDALVLDHYWYGEGEIKKSVAMGDLDWYSPSFPSGAQLVSDLKKMGIETVLITQPFILTNSKNFALTSSRGWLGKDAEGKTLVVPYFYFGETGLLDIFNPAAQDWFWQQYKKHILAGVQGWWGDLGEPEVHPSEMQHVAGPADEVHNIYGHYWAKMIAEGYARDFARQRPFILMRAGFAGSQRFGLIPWSGDVSRTWGGFRSQPGLALNMGLGGLAYMHSDLGGFAEGSKTPELYRRWLQYGVFQPIYRPHSQESVPAEPVFYEEPLKSLIRKQIELRYRLLPYHYTMAFQNQQEGKPLMRPLFFEEPENPALRNLADTYFWGDAFLVAPVLNPGQKSRRVYLPKGQQWFDFWTGQAFAGGQWLNLSLQDETIPVFVRGGAFIPQVPVFQSTQAYHSREIFIDFYWDSTQVRSSGIWYEDDGRSPQAFAQKKYELVEMQFEQQNKLASLRLNKSKTRYEGMPTLRTLTLRVRGLSQVPREIRWQGKIIPVGQDKRLTWQKEDKTLVLKVEWKGNKPLVLSWLR